MTKLVSTLTHTAVGALIAVVITVAPTEGTTIPGAGAPAIEAIKDVETYEITGIAAPAFKAIDK